MNKMEINAYVERMNGMFRGTAPFDFEGLDDYDRALVMAKNLDCPFDATGLDQQTIDWVKRKRLILASDRGQ